MTVGHDSAASAVDEWRSGSGTRAGGGGSSLSRGDTSNLADILERVLDKGIVIAGDISVSLVDVELLTIKLRLLIASVDKAREMGINWWENDPFLTTTPERSQSDGDGTRPGLEERFSRLENAVDQLTSALQPAGHNGSTTSRRRGSQDG